MRCAVRAICVAALALAPLVPAAPASAAAGVIREISLTGTVDPLVAAAVERGIARADRDRASLVLVRIDTPGGLSSSMRRIVQAVLGARTPVVCWVGPSGARAASAGAIVLLGCPVAAMAPGTNAGAAHPVGFRGEVLAEKVTNDAAAYARSLAERWGRNAEWAEDAVRESVSASAGEALALKIVDLMAADRAELLRELQGRTVRTAAGDTVIADLSVSGIEPVRLRVIEAILHSLVDPTLAFLLFLIGIGLIAFEVLSPGGIGGVFGALFLLASLVMLGMLPVNIAGLVLLLASVVFFVIDVKTPGTGVPTAAGVATLVAGGLFLFDVSVPNARVSRVAVFATAAATALFFAVVVQAAFKARRMGPAAAAVPAAGMLGTVVRALRPQGVVYASGEEWTATSDGAEIPEGAPVRVVAVQGLTLHVVPEEQSGGFGGDSRSERSER
ncbi:MAG: NfeD family protein [Actinomycetota bacterium]